MSAVRFLDSRALRASGGMPRLSYATATATAAQPYNWKRDTNELLNATEVAAEQSAKQRTATIQVSTRLFPMSIARFAHELRTIVPCRCRDPTHRLIGVCRFKK